MIRSPVWKTVTVVLVSATMVLSNSLWAKDSSGSIDSADAKEGVPVVFETATLPDGSTAVLAMAPIPVADEASVLGQLAAHDPSNLSVGVSGVGDVALTTLNNSGQFGKISIFDHEKIENAPALASAPKSWRQKIVQKVRTMTNFCKHEKVGLLTAVYVSGLSTSYIIYETSSVSAGMKALVALFSWAAFQGMASHSWENYLEHGGELLKNAFAKVSSLFGHKLTAKEKRVFEVSGKFYSSWAANTAVSGFVLWQAGTLDGLMQALWFGFLGSNDINDAHVAERLKDGKISDQFFRRFILIRILAGSAFEVAALLNVPHVQTALATVTIGGLAYLAVGREVETRFVPKVRSKVQNCQTLLQRKTKGAA